MLSVYRDLGVVLREGREDNNNRPGEDLSAYRLVRPGDLVINKMKTWQGSLGVSEHLGIVSPAYFVAEPVSFEVYGPFMHHLLRSQPLIAEYGMRSKGIRPAQWDLPWDEFADIRVTLPPPTTQRAIADFLDRETARIDALIAAKRRMIEVLEERRLQTIAALTEMVPATPGGRTRRLKHICRIERGRFTHRPRNDADMYGGDAPFVQTGDVRSADKYLRTFSQTLSIRGRQTSRSFPPDTILMAIAANVGDVAITTFETWCPDSVVGFLPSAAADTTYLYYLLLGQRSRINETSTESTQENTNIALLGELPVPLLDLHEQRAIASRLSDIDDRSTSARTVLRHQLELLAEHRQALITAAVTGELDVPGMAA